MEPGCSSKGFGQRRQGTDEYKGETPVLTHTMEFRSLHSPTVTNLSMHIIYHLWLLWEFSSAHCQCINRLDMFGWLILHSRTSRRMLLGHSQIDWLSHLTKAPHSVKPIFTSEFHKDEAAKMTDFRLIWTCFAMQGFAMDFSPNEAGRFLSGSSALRSSIRSRLWAATSTLVSAAGCGGWTPQK